MNILLFFSGSNNSNISSCACDECKAKTNQPKEQVKSPTDVRNLNNTNRVQELPVKQYTPNHYTNAGLDISECEETFKNEEHKYGLQINLLMQLITTNRC